MAGSRWPQDRERPTALLLHLVDEGRARVDEAPGMKLPDCCVLLAAMESGAVVATFDDQLARAAERLHLAVLT